MVSKALVILSGGQDSSTCLAIALKQFDEVHAITFNYGQRHLIEVNSAIKIAKILNVKSHEIIDVGSKSLIGTSPLVSTNPVESYDSIDNMPNGVEPTFVYGRNILFLTIAANRAACLGIKDIYIGVCQEDFNGYWDCRQEFIDSMAKTLGIGITGTPDYFKIHTPLINLNKAQSIKLAMNCLVDKFNIVMANTHTCYNGVKGGCGKCHSCLVRESGFKQLGIKDPIKNNG